jgi:hypothetical protein
VFRSGAPHCILQILGNLKLILVIRFFQTDFQTNDENVPNEKKRSSKHRQIDDGGHRRRTPPPPPAYFLNTDFTRWGVNRRVRPECPPSSNLFYKM